MGSFSDRLSPPRAARSDGELGPGRAHRHEQRLGRTALQGVPAPPAARDPEARDRSRPRGRDRGHGPDAARHPHRGRALSARHHERRRQDPRLLGDAALGQRGPADGMVLAGRLHAAHPGLDGGRDGIGGADPHLAARGHRHLRPTGQGGARQHPGGQRQIHHRRAEGAQAQPSRQGPLGRRAAGRPQAARDRLRHHVGGHGRRAAAGSAGAAPSRSSAPSATCVRRSTPIPALPAPPPGARPATVRRRTAARPRPGGPSSK